MEASNTFFPLYWTQLYQSLPWSSRYHISSDLTEHAQWRTRYSTNKDQRQEAKTTINCHQSKKYQIDEKNSVVSYLQCKD